MARIQFMKNIEEKNIIGNETQVINNNEIKFQMDKIFKVTKC